MRRCALAALLLLAACGTRGDFGRERSHGIAFTNSFADGIHDWGNTVVGLRNPMAMPLEFTFDGEKIVAEFTAGALYVGPPGHMHGGVIALLLDQALGTLSAEIG